MWNYYIDAMLELNKNPTQLNGFKRFLLGRAFAGANNANHMSETNYLQYIELLNSNNSKDENIIHVFKKATQIYSTSENFWIQYLRYYIQANNVKKIKEIFNAARTRLGSNCANIWELYLIFLSSRSIYCEESKVELEKMIDEVVVRPEKSLNVLKARVLELVANTMDIYRARKTYKLFIESNPSCYEVHCVMADLEATQVTQVV